MRNYIFYIAIIITLFSGCIKKPEPPPPPVQQNWSSFDPLNIPYRQRKQALEDSNIVVNPSFEEGKVLLDSVLASFTLKGWKKIGNNLEWVDTAQSKYSITDVSNGQYAIKIHRNTYNEMEEYGEGIMSDFIKVIPGNYRLGMDLKLRDISSNMARLGVGVFDAVYIKLYFFDKNKLPLDDDPLNISSYGLINNSFKGIPFAHFKKIDSTGWVRILARSHNIPYYEGYIPDEARYVKIYIGLKGKGSLWVDNVEFKYTDKNFSLIEKLKSFFDTSASVYNLLIPTPKIIKQKEAIIYYESDSIEYPLPYIIIPRYAKKETRIAAQILKTHLDSVYSRLITDKSKKKEIRITYYPSKIPEDTNTLVFSIGNSILFESYKYGLPLDKIEGKNQGYIIKRIQDVFNVVYIKGYESIGDLYGTNTLIQLLSADDFIYYDAEIIDYPSYNTRGVVIDETQFDSLYNRVGWFDNLNLLRFNKIYLNDNENKENWYYYDRNYISRLYKLWQFTYSNYMKYGVILNPYNHFEQSLPLDSIEKQTLQKWYHSPNKINLLNSKINYALFRGANSVIISANYLPYENENIYNYSLYSEYDINNYFDLGIAQAEMMNSVNTYILNNYKDKKIFFMPPWSTIMNINNSEWLANNYFNNFNKVLKNNINLVWEGTSSISTSFDEIDVYHYKNTTNSDFIFHDFVYKQDKTIEEKQYYMNHSKMINLLDIFQPYNPDIPDSFSYELINEEYIVAFFPNNELELVTLASISDFLWNQDSYHPDYFVWKYLNKKYGVKLAKEIIYFNKYYYQLVEIKYKISQQIEARKNIKQIESILSQINNSLLRMEKFYPEYSIINDLKQLKINIEDELNELTAELTIE